METIYQRLSWLDIGQAVAYLKALTADQRPAAQVTERLLLQLCELGDCTAYIDATGMDGLAICEEQLKSVSGWRHQEILSPRLVEPGGEEGLAPHSVKGSYSLRPLLPGQGEEDGLGWWEIGMYPADVPIPKALLRFKPADIQALAVKTNNATAPFSSSNTELESLLQQLEGERNRREAAEAEVATLRQQLADVMTAPKGGGLYFPYATKQLEALRTTAVKYWGSHPTDKSQPTQVAVQMELCDLLGLELKNGSPPRKAIELAGTIKPDA